MLTFALIANMVLLKTKVLSAKVKKENECIDGAFDIQYWINTVQMI